MNYTQTIKDYKDLQVKARLITEFILISDCFNYRIFSIELPPTETENSVVTVEYTIYKDFKYIFHIPLHILLADDWRPLAAAHKEKLREEKYQRELREAQQEAARLEYENWLETERYMQ